jgi:hypothetical protein
VAAGAPRAVAAAAAAGKSILYLVLIIRGDNPAGWHIYFVCSKKPFT